MLCSSKLAEWWRDEETMREHTHKLVTSPSVQFRRNINSQIILQLYRRKKWKNGTWKKHQNSLILRLEKGENWTTVIKLANLVTAKFAIGKRWENSPLVLAWKCFEDKSSVQVEEIELEDMKLILQMVLEESVEATVRLRFIGETAIDRTVEQLGTNRNLIIVSFL